MTFEKANKTELYQLCRKAGLAVGPAASKAELIEKLEGISEPVAAQHPVDRYRLGLIGFATEYWDKIQTQIMCPMRGLKTNPKPCYGCLDTQTVACLINNRESGQLIERHVPKKEEK